MIIFLLTAILFAILIGYPAFRRGLAWAFIALLVLRAYGHEKLADPVVSPPPLSNTPEIAPPAAAPPSIAPPSTPQPPRRYLQQ